MSNTLKTIDGVVMNHPLAPYTYAKVGGPAEYFYEATSKTDLTNVLRAAMADGIPFRLLGAGSNILVSDKGVAGLVVRNRADHIFHEGSIVRAETGVVVNQLVNQTLSYGLQGLEEFLGIPGTVGGAVYNNSHHLKHLIGDYISSVEVLNRDGQVDRIERQDMEFAYDSSRLQRTGEIALEATFELAPYADTEELRAVATAALKRRRSTQPLEYPSTGCMFKNIGEKNARAFHTPDGITSAGALIDKAGLKGTKIGGAMISDVHANFIINLEKKATAADYKQISDLMIEKVKEKFGVTLEREVFLWGDF
jgi:UDP-N-acetylmuramate dehydrogenase